MSFIYTRKPSQQTLSLEEIFLSASNQSKIQQLLDEFNYRTALNAYDIPLDNKVLLYGPSGCGKTATANAIAKKLNKKIISLQLGGFVSYKLGETARNITSIFRKAKLENAVLFIDEFDFIGKSRDYDEKDSGEMKRVVNTLLQQIDNMDQDTLLMGATNFVDVIDSALLRRFQIRLSFDLPSENQLETYYEYLFQSFPDEFISMEKKFDISYAEAKDYAFQKIKENIINKEKMKKQYLFSYGTLQLDQVQKETYGRILEGKQDKLSGYKIEDLEIHDENVLETSGKKFHPIAQKTGNSNDVVKGKIFEITTEELLQTDLYEVSDYRRVLVDFDSGKKAWIYVGK